MTALIWLALLGPALAGGSALLLPHPRWVLVADVAASVVILGSGLGLLAGQASGSPVTTAGGLLRVDPLSAYLLVVVGAVALTASWAGLARSRAASPRGPRYSALVCLFLAAMVLAVLADDLGVTWVAVEATTIATAFLVGHTGGRKAVEAAWKYVVLASVGVGIAFLGLVLLYAATRAAGDPTLSWVRLVERPPAGIDPTVTRMGLALAALGFATKAGLAPMHSWLPDAHSQAPAPVSGLMSGVLLAVAFGAVLRVERLDAALLGGATVRHLMLAGGLLSLLVAAAMILTQRDYKRLLAYSSIEHMGLVAVAAGIGGPLALTAMLVHLLAHGLVKAATFVVAGRMLTLERTSAIGSVRGLVARDPRLAVPFLLGAVALVGLPPFGLFVTEAAVVVAGFRQGYGWATGAVLALLLVVFVGIGRHALTMTLGRGGGDPRPVPAGAGGVLAAEASAAPLAPIVLAVAVTALVPFLVGPFADVLRGAVDVLGGAR
jgi:hydrogenase-4 component F